MKVFVSHSMKDQSFLKGIDVALTSWGITTLVAEHEVELNVSITEKIKRMIDSCHLGLFLLTKQGIKSGFVREEIGYLEAKQKPSLIVFEKGVEKKYGGFKYGHDSVQLDPDSPHIAIKKITEILLEHWRLMYKNQRLKDIQQQEKRKTEQQNALIGIGFLVGVLIYASNN